MLIIFLTHDVDWDKKGAPIEHIMQRKDRFSEKVLNKASYENPYYNIPEIIDIEKRIGVKSTFFFRTFVGESVNPPPSYDPKEYEEDIRYLVENGWEVALHSDPTSIDSLKKLRQEKNELESITGVPITGNRVHYLKTKPYLYKMLSELGFSYDSTLKKFRNVISKHDFGFIRNEVIVFPISFADFTLPSMLNDEKDVTEILKEALKIFKGLAQEPKIMTILWHNCSLKMKFGSKYEEVLKYLASFNDVKFLTGRELVNRLNFQ